MLHATTHWILELTIPPAAASVSVRSEKLCLAIRRNCSMVLSSMEDPNMQEPTGSEAWTISSTLSDGLMLVVSSEV